MHRTVGLAWERLFVDGTERPLEWGSLPTEQWALIHLEIKSAFSDAIHFCSEV